MAKYKYRYCSAKTGYFVSKKYADKHPKTTVKEKLVPTYNSKDLISGWVRVSKIMLQNIR